MKYIAVIGPGKSMPGGMLTVIEQILAADMPSIDEKKIHIVTASKRHKVLTFFVALIELLILSLTRKISIAHINMSERGSVKRTALLLTLFDIFNVKSIVHSHGGEIENEYSKMSEEEKILLSKTLSKSTAFIALTEEWKNFWKEIVPEEIIKILPNGVEIPEYYTKHFRKGNKLNLLFLGFIGEVKGTYDLVEAAKILQDSNFAYHLTIAGNGEREKCLRIIEKCGVENNVEVLSWVSGKTKANLLKNNDVLILPSHFESFGISALEAMAWQLPVVCGDAGHTKEIVDDEISGYVAKTGDPKSIAEKITMLESEKRLKEFGKEGYLKVKNNYSVETIMKHLEKIYIDVLNS